MNDQSKAERGMSTLDAIRYLDPICLAALALRAAENGTLEAARGIARCRDKKMEAAWYDKLNRWHRIDGAINAALERYFYNLDNKMTVHQDWGKE